MWIATSINSVRGKGEIAFSLVKEGLQSSEDKIFTQKQPLLGEDTFEGDKIPSLGGSS